MPGHTCEPTSGCDVSVEAASIHFLEPLVRDEMLQSGGPSIRLTGTTFSLYTHTHLLVLTWPVQLFSIGQMACASCVAYICRGGRQPAQNANNLANHALDVSYFNLRNNRRSHILAKWKRSQGNKRMH